MLYPTHTQHEVRCAPAGRVGMGASSAMSWSSSSSLAPRKRAIAAAIEVEAIRLGGFARNIDTEGSV